MPTSPPVESPLARTYRLRAEAAERRLAQLQAEPQRQVMRGTTARTTAPVVVPVPEVFRIGRGADLRQIAPSAARVLARAGDEISAREVPHLVWQRDGLGALAQLATATGEVPALTNLLRAAPELTADPTSIGPNGDDFAIFRGGLHPRKEQLRCRSKAELEALLVDICRAGDADGLIG